MPQWKLSPQRSVHQRPQPRAGRHERVCSLHEQAMCVCTIQYVLCIILYLFFSTLFVVWTTDATVQYCTLPCNVNGVYMHRYIVCTLQYRYSSYIYCIYQVCMYMPVLYLRESLPLYFLLIKDFTRTFKQYLYQYCIYSTVPIVERVKRMNNVRLYIYINIYSIHIS